MYSSAGVFHSLWNHWRRISLRAPCTHGMTPGFCHSASATLCVAIAMLVPCVCFASFGSVPLLAVPGSTTIHKHNNRFSFLAVDRFLSPHRRRGGTVNVLLHHRCGISRYTGGHVVYIRIRVIAYAAWPLKTFHRTPNTKYQSHIRSIPYPTNPRQFQGSHQIIQHYILRSCANDEHRLCARVPQQHRCCFMYFSQWCT